MYDSYVIFALTSDGYSDASPTSSEPATPPISPIPSLRSSSQSTVSSQKQVNRLNPQSPVFVPRFSSPLTRSTYADPTSEISFDTNTQVTSPPSDSDSSSDDLTAAYVKLKLKIAETTAHKGVEDDISFLEKLQMRLKKIQDDYLFDKDEAEVAYTKERQKVFTQRLEDRLRGVRPPSPVNKKPPEKPIVPPERPSLELDSSPKNIFDEASDEEASGGMFELLEQMPETETTPQGTTVHIRDLPLPKHWSGKTPRLLLQETVHRLDRYAIIDFQPVSGESRAKRASVHIRWSRAGEKVSEWTMEDVACHSESQAEQYIATVALHSVTYPSVAGFAVGNTAAASTATSFRLLPPIFRDLWAEFEEKRKSADDATNRKIWGRLKSIMETKVADYKVRIPSPRMPLLIKLV